MANARDAYLAMAANAPHQLLAAVRAGMEPHELTYAAEALGHVRNLSVWLDLGKLLEHDSPLVREGAIYGVSAGDCLVALGNTLRRMAETDPSAGVRAAAREAIGDG